MENPETPSSASNAPAPGPLPAAERLNPFTDDVCAGPYGVEENRSVPGLNADILQQLTGAIDERQSSQGRPGGQPLLLLTAPRAGYGKTHLLGRLAAAAGGQVVLVPLAFRLEDEIGLSAVAVRGLESMARAETPRLGWTRLREACAGVCAALVRRLIESGTLPCANPEQALRVLKGDPMEVFDAQGNARLIGEWIRKHDAQLRKPMTEQAMWRVPAIPTALTAWVDALLNHAVGGSMSEVAVLRLLAADEANEGPVTWLRLLGLWRPVVVLVDHLDAYYRNPEAGQRIASLLLDMSEMDGVHVVLSLNQDVWQATFGHHLPSAMEDRLTASQMLLRGIGEGEAATLLRLRLKHTGVREKELRDFESFVDVKRYFLGRPLGSVSARTFLRHAARQWELFQQTIYAPSQPPAVDPLAAAAPESTAPVVELPPLQADPIPAAPPTAVPAATTVAPALAAAEVPSAAPRPAPPGSVIFDAYTKADVRRMAEGLAEPTPALPQEDEAPLDLPPPPAAAEPTPAIPPSNGVHVPPLAEEDEPPPANVTPSSHFSPNSPTSATAFESLREMLGKLRHPSAQAAAAAAASQEDANTVAERLASVMNGTPATDEAELPAPAAVPPLPQAPGIALGSAVGTPPPVVEKEPSAADWNSVPPAPAPTPALPPPPPAVQNVVRVPAAIGAVTPPPPPALPVTPPNAERDALLGRYEALRLQMSAEASTLPLDYTKLAELIRLAGRRFPLVRFSEHELPGMTGRYAMCWSLQGMEILFGMANFADASYWRTLSGFAAGRLAELSAPGTATHPVPPKLKIATFKTDREQQAWTFLQSSSAFPEVLQPLVDAIHLDASNVAALYAMQRIIKESESGALQTTPAQVMSVLARELDFFWKRVTRMVRE